MSEKGDGFWILAVLVFVLAALSVIVSSGGAEEDKICPCCVANVAEGSE